MQNLGQRVATGATWMIALKFAERSLGLISTVVLARLLLPADFGLVALAMAIIAVLELMGSFSFDLALIQNQQAERRHYDTAWTFNVIFGLVSAIILAAIAIPVAAFYSEPRLEAVMYVLAFSAAIQGFENIGTVAFRKELELHKEFRYMMLKKLAGFSVTLSLAFFLRNHWALVLGMLASRLAGVSLSYWVHPYRPKLSLAARHDLFHFSKWMLISNILYFLNHRSADFIVGKMVGTHGLGVFSISYELSNLPTTELAAPINRAVFPGYAKLAENRENLRDAFCKVIGVLALFALPAGIGIAVLAEPIVQVVLGQNWLEAIPLVQLLAIYGSIMVLNSNTGFVYLALGKPRLMTTIGAATAALLLILLLLGTHYFGLLGAAWAFILTQALAVPCNYLILVRQLKLPFKRLAAIFWRTCVGALLLVPILMLAQATWSAPQPLWEAVPRLLILVLAGGVSYASIVWVLWRLCGCPAGAEQYIVQRIGAIMPGKRRAP